MITPRGQYEAPSTNPKLAALPFNAPIFPPDQLNIEAHTYAQIPNVFSCVETVTSCLNWGVASTVIVVGIIITGASILGVVCRAHFGSILI